MYNHALHFYNELSFKILIIICLILYVICIHWEYAMDQVHIVMVLYMLINYTYFKNNYPYVFATFVM